MTNHLTSHAHMVSREGRLYMVDLGYGQNRLFETYLQRLMSPQDSTYTEATKCIIHKGASCTIHPPNLSSNGFDTAENDLF